MGSIMHRDPELEASFSFSCHNFNSALAVFSDEDDGNDDQYIEIALEHPTSSYGDEDHRGSRQDNQLEFRISFSSTAPTFLELPKSGLVRADTVDSIGSELSEIVTTPSSAASISTLSCSSADTCWAAASGTIELPAARTQKTVKRKVQFGSVNRLLNSFMYFTSAESSVMVNNKDASPDHETSSKQVAIHCNNHNELVRSRKPTKMTKTMNGGIIMKFLIKCRSINIRTMLATFMKPYQFIYCPQANGSSQRKMKKPFEGWLLQREKVKGERSKVFDINLDAIRGVLETMSTSLSCKDRKTKSCPTASTRFRSSIQQGYPIESNSIQAAIAHCKRSFGQTSELGF